MNQASESSNSQLIAQLLGAEEGTRFETKRLAGKLNRPLETVVAFANTEGGIVALGVEDSGKASGADRLYGIDEQSSVYDDLQRLVATRITPPIESVRYEEIPCKLRDGTSGRLAIVRVPKSSSVHSIAERGTWIRMDKSNRHLAANEIVRLAMGRGHSSAETLLANVDFDLLDTDIWQIYASKRRLTRAVPEALRHLGLAKTDDAGRIRPTRAAVLLFAEEPGGLLGTKAGIRVFHYKGEKIERGTNPNLLRTPVTVSGPLLTQIRHCYSVVLRELATGVQMGPLGFEIVQQYPARVIREAITNAVVHRDYAIPGDIHVRIFSDRIEIDSPGILPGNVTVGNLREIGSFARNPMIVSNLREFPDPPNLDAGEGVRMMFATMDQAGLYPPLYVTRATTGRDQVRVVLRNENRPSIWDQICDFAKKRGSIANSELRRLLKTDDTLWVSKVLRRLVDIGLLEVANPQAAKQHRRYKLSEHDPLEFFS